MSRERFGTQAVGGALLILHVSHLHVGKVEANLLRWTFFAPIVILCNLTWRKHAFEPSTRFSLSSKIDLHRKAIEWMKTAASHVANLRCLHGDGAEVKSLTCEG